MKKSYLLLSFLNKNTPIVMIIKLTMLISGNPVNTQGSVKLPLKIADNALVT